MKVLVTGGSGFIGSNLVEFLNENGHEPLSAARNGTVALDVTDTKAVFDLVKTSRPDAIFHLAAQSLPRVSWEKPVATFEVNVSGTINLFEAIRHAGLDPITIVCGSSSQYAASVQPIAETWPMEPSSPYAASKIAQDHIAQLYGAMYKLRVIRVRPFFISGPGKQGDVCSDIARQIAAFERDEHPGSIRIGNGEVIRDFLDVSDAVRALYRLMHAGVAGEAYNISSGKGVTIRQVAERLLDAAKIKLALLSDPSLFRALDEKIKIGDPGKLRSLGWSPQVSLDEMLSRILGYWRHKLAQGATAT